MKLYLIRHGVAVERIGGSIRNDAERPLTEGGKQETKLVASGIKRLGCHPDFIVTSPLVRAHQTAEIFANVFDCQDDLVISDALVPAGLISNVYKSLGKLAKANEIFLVGHQPDMTRLAQALLWTGPELDVPFKKAGVCRIDVVDIPPTIPGTLKWFITPRIACLLASKS